MPECNTYKGKITWKWRRPKRHNYPRQTVLFIQWLQWFQSLIIYHSSEQFKSQLCSFEKPRHFLFFICLLTGYSFNIISVLRRPRLTLPCLTRRRKRKLTDTGLHLCAGLWRTNHQRVQQFRMGVISFRFKYRFACFAAANHLLNKQLLYLRTVPHFTFKLCVCFAAHSLLWSIINNFAQSRGLYWREPTCSPRSPWSRRPPSSSRIWQTEGNSLLSGALSSPEAQKCAGRKLKERSRTMTKFQFSILNSK